MSKAFRMVERFNDQVLNIGARPHGLQPLDEADLSYTQLTEEAKEYLDARASHDLPGCVDAAMDSIVFSMGILYKMGVTDEEFDTIFEVIMNANMTKKKGVAKGREGFDAADAAKPDDFVAPEQMIMEILEG